MGYRAALTAIQNSNEDIRACREYKNSQFVDWIQVKFKEQASERI